MCRSARRKRRLAFLGLRARAKPYLALRCIAGLEQPERGHVSLNDRVLFDSDQRIRVPAPRAANRNGVSALRAFPAPHGGPKTSLSDCGILRTLRTRYRLDCLHSSRAHILKAWATAIRKYCPEVNNSVQRWPTCARDRPGERFCSMSRFRLSTRIFAAKWKPSFKKYSRPIAAQRSW